MEPGMFRSDAGEGGKAGDHLDHRPKPAAQAVFMMAPMEPLAPSLMAGGRVLAWFRFSRQATRMPHTRGDDDGVVGGQLNAGKAIEATREQVEHEHNDHQGDDAGDPVPGGQAES